MAATTGAFGYLLFDILRDVYGESYNELPKMYPKMVDVENSDQAFEDYVELVTFGLVPRFSQGGTIALQDPRQSYKTRYEHDDFSLGFEVTRMLWRDDKSKKIAQLPKALADAVNRTVETMVANLFNRGFNSSFVGGDNVALFSTAHPTDGGNRQNRPTNNVDPVTTGYQQAEIDLADWRDAKGNRIAVSPTLVFGNPFNRAAFKKLFDSPDDPSTAKRSINPFHHAADYMVNPYLSAQKGWFIRTNVPGGGGRWFWREEQEMMEMNVQDRLVRRYMVHFAGSAGWDNWRNYWGSPGI